ncbi:hypothetical protein BDQ17DRAFT_1204084, partial [Cyathus striatus]
VLALAAMYFVWFKQRKSRLPYPPGPPAEPILGHLRSIPSTNQEVVFREWSKIYGKVL